MIQNFFTDSLIKNYTAPSYPIFIALQNYLGAINSKKSMRDAKGDIVALIQKVGAEAEKFVLIQLFDCLELPECKQKPNGSYKVQLLVELLKEYSTTTIFLSYFPEILAKMSKNHKVSTFLNKMLLNLKIPLYTQIVIALSLYLSDRSEYSELGEEQLIKKLIELKKNGKGLEVPEKIVEELLFQISRNPQLNQKLQEEYNYLLQVCQNTNRNSEIRIYNYFKGDWQFFANEAPIIEKSPTFSVKKVDYLKDLGPSATHHIDTLKTLIAEVGTLNQEDIFECLVMMAEDKGRHETGIDKFVNDVIYANKKNYKNDDLKKVFGNEISSKKTYSNWSIDNFLTYCSQNIQNLKWQNVIGHFDRPKLVFQSEEHFYNLMKIFEKIKRLGQKWKIPEALYFKKWVHPSSQATFLMQVFKCKEPECLQIHEIPNKKIHKSVKDEHILAKQIWGYIELVQLLVEVSQYRFMQVRELFEIPMAKYPELLLQTLSQIKPNKGQALLDEVFSQILPNFLHNHSTNIKLLENLWESNQDLVISCICEIYKAESKKDNAFNLSRVLDITQSIKDSLLPFTTWNDYEFSIPLAVIAGKRQFLNFEPWLQDRIQKLGNSFVKAILMYIDNYLVKQIKKLSVSSHKDTILEKAQLNIELLNKIFFTIMMKMKRQDMAPRNFEYLKRMFKQCCFYFPEIADGNIPDQMEKQTEREMNKIYKEQFTVKQAIQRMKKLKNSKKPEDQQQLASHITFLCSELPYHHSYPDRQLMITADIFSGIINANLIEKKVYQMFLHVLSEDLKEDNQKYVFAIRVMEKIKAKLAHESWFCEHLIDSELIMKKNPQFVEELIKQLQPPKALPIEKQKKLKQAIRLKNNPPIQPSSIITVLPSLGDEQPLYQLPIDIPSPTTGVSSMKKLEMNDYDILTVLDKTKYINFPEKQSKIGKINLACNTISINNIDDKAKELERILDCDEAIKILANNIMFRRISISQNNGMQIFLRLVEKLPQLEKPVFSLTYKILQKWFSLTGKSVNDKKFSCFKNIGSWLGKLTIGRGYPVPIHRLNLKNILIASFTNGNRLSMNISVVLKIIGYINLHPEIFRPTSPWLSRLIGTITEIEEKLKEDQNTKAQIKAFFKEISIKFDSVPMPPTLNSNNRIIISELDRYIKVDEQLEKYYSKLGIDLKMIITRAVNDSIQQIVQPVIDRAVKIAKVTTKQLILKDFALQPSPDRFRESSYNVVKNMAGPLAHVTCRQPLKASMNRSLKALLSQHISDNNEIDNIIQKAIPDNLDFGCTLIKQAVIESAEDSIKKDSTINQAIQMRVDAIKNNKEFKDQLPLIQIPSIVPEQLRPRAGGLSAQQYFVYSEFKNERRSEILDKTEESSVIQKIMEIISEKAPPKNIKEILLTDSSAKDQLAIRVQTVLAKQTLDQSQLNYYIEVCQIIADFVQAKDLWKYFKEVADLKNKQIHPLIKRMVRQKCFPENSMHQIDENNEEENKVVILFEKWLDTAHEKIEPFLRTLEEIFNKSENQIKIFFSYSLFYAMHKIEESMAFNNQSYDTNYIEDYSKLIIISYKTIASNNCSLYLEHTIQAILQVFDKLQNSETSSELSYQRPFFKLFTNLIGDVTRKEYDIDNQKVLTFYCVLAKQLQKIGPLQYPGFSFAWVELISNKNLIPALLNHHQYWDLYFNLLSSLFKFMKQYITQEHLYHKENGEIYQCFYKGVLKLIIVIIHDFPNFLSAFSLQLCLLPGPRFIQLTNMIISAYPKQMKFQFPLKIENEKELRNQVKRGGQPKYYKLKFDKKKFNEYLKADPRDQNFQQKLLTEDDETLQNFILYAGWSHENSLQIEQCSKKLSDILIQIQDPLKQRLVAYIVNLIRYPNSVTLFFITLSQELIFTSSNDASIISVRDSLLTNILNRMNAQGPQAWGLDYLVKQLMMQKNTLIQLNVPKEILKLL